MLRFACGAVALSTPQVQAFWAPRSHQAGGIRRVHLLPTSSTPPTLPGSSTSLVSRLNESEEPDAITKPQSSRAEAREVSRSFLDDDTPARRVCC